MCLAIVSINSVVEMGEIGVLLVSFGSFKTSIVIPHKGLKQQAVTVI